MEEIIRSIKNFTAIEKLILITVIFIVGSIVYMSSGIEMNFVNRCVLLEHKTISECEYMDAMIKSRGGNDFPRSR